MRKHKLKYRDENNNKVTFYLNIPTSYNFGGANSMIIKESATGDGAVVINNGRLQEEIPITGTLFAVSNDSKNKRSNSVSNFSGIDVLNENIEILNSIRTERRVVDFIGPFHNGKSNQYFIKDLIFTTLNDDNSIDFTMTLTENRTANVESAEKALTVKNGYVEALRNAIEQAEGMPDDSDIETVAESDGIISLQTYLDSQTAIVAPIISATGVGVFGLSLNVASYIPKWVKDPWQNFVLRNNAIPENVAI